MGSAGDVHPMVALARLLARRGHDVVVIAQAFVADMARRAGLHTITVGNKEEQERILRDPRLWHRRKAFSLIATFIPVTTRETLPAILDEIVPGETVIVGGALAFAARIAAERRDVPLITVQLQPSVFFSVEDPAVVMANGEWLQRSPVWFRRAFFSLVHWMVDRKLRKVTAKLRRDAGVRTPMPRGVMKTWWHSPDAVVCLFPEWYAAKAGDWPEQAVLTRFPLYDESKERPAMPELERFLADGGGDDPPVVITPGSANLQAADFIREALTACVQLNKRVIIITPYADQVPGLARGLPSTVAHFNYVPFSQVFPAAAAVIHHGGIGTTAQCLAGGVPQLIMPMAHDQPDNANRVKKLGVGDFLYPKHFRAPAIAEKLEQLTTSTAVRAACARVRQKMREQMSPTQLAELLETIAERNLRVRQINGPGVPA
jgi:UDP:flavonoid glycosyltransferase YjiC (YdhE family)